jgi:hypothetical protein
MALGAALWALPALLRADLLGGIQAAALAAIVAAVATLRPVRATPSRLAGGVLLGLTALAALSLLQTAGGWALLPTTEWGPVARLADLSRTAVRSGRATGWLDHPNLWASQVLVPALAIIALACAPRWRWAAALPTALIVLGAGSRATLLGLVAGLALLGLRSLRARPFGRREGVTLLLALAAALALTLLPPWRSRVVAIADLLAPRSAPEATGPNLLGASADLEDALWFGRGVEVAPLTGGGEGWRLVKTLPGNAQRLQQRLDLAPGAYTLSVELRPEGDARAGLLSSWSGGDGAVHTLGARLVDGSWRTTARGAFEILAFTTEPADGGWLRQRAEGAIPFPIGFTPDRREGVGAALEVRRPQLVEGLEALPYAPTRPPDRERLSAQASAQGRGRIFTAAWSGALDRPLLGHGDGAFAEQFRNWSGNSGITVNHAHNLALQTLFARGIVGLLGLTLLLVGMALAARGDPGFLIVLAAVLVANLFDHTFWTSGQSYLVAAAAGLSATGWAGSTGRSAVR